MIQQLSDIYLEDALKSGRPPTSLEKQETEKEHIQQSTYTERRIPGERGGDTRRGKVHKREHTRKRNIQYSGSDIYGKGKREQTHEKRRYSREDIHGEETYAET